jgi:hypothetical protein
MDQPARSIRTPARIGRSEGGDDRAEASPRRRVPDRAEHHASVPELEPDQQHAQGDVPRLARQRHAGEHDGLDERASGDDRPPAVPIGPHAPERHERHPDEEEQRAEQPDEPEAVGAGDPHRAQELRQQRVDLGDSRALDEGRDPVDREDPPPVGRARRGL